MISERLGHSVVSFTLDKYGHLYEKADQQAANKVGDLLVEAKAKANVRQPLDNEAKVDAPAG